jgi:hypothetical protein
MSGAGRGADVQASAKRASHDRAGTRDADSSCNMGWLISSRGPPGGRAGGRAGSASTSRVDERLLGYGRRTADFPR